MLIKEQKTKVRCDFGLCKNQATYVIGDDGVLPNRKIYICTECLKKLYECLGGTLVPKSPENLIKKAMTKSKQL